MKLGTGFLLIMSVVLASFLITPAMGDLTKFVTPGAIWKVQEYGPMGNWDGRWVVSDDGVNIHATWSNGAIKDTLQFFRVTNNRMMVTRKSMNGNYDGTLSTDGSTISGKGSWYNPGQTWTVQYIGNVKDDMKDRVRPISQYLDEKGVVSSLYR